MHRGRQSDLDRILGLMARRSLLRRIAAGGIAAVAALAMSGCASGYDSVLWRQMDRQEAEAYRLIDEAEAWAQTSAGFVADLTGSPAYWNGHTLPAVDPEEPATFYFNVRDSDVDEFGAPRASFDVLVHSGARPERVPREDPGRGSGGPYAGPPSVYTCYTLVVTFAAEHVWRTHRSHDSGKDVLTCPAELVEAIADGAQYVLPTEFDG